MDRETGAREGARELMAAAVERGARSSHGVSYSCGAAYRVAGPCGGVLPQIRPRRVAAVLTHGYERA